MDIYTKMVLINWVVLFGVMVIDIVWLDNALERSRVVIRAILGIWTIASFISIPAWLVYLIWVLL